jgi:hypothetical protein
MKEDYPAILISLIHRMRLLIFSFMFMDDLFQLQMECIVTSIFPTQHVLLLPLPEAHHEAVLHVRRGIQFGLHHLETIAISLNQERELLQGKNR